MAPALRFSSLVELIGDSAAMALLGGTPDTNAVRRTVLELSALGARQGAAGEHLDAGRTYRAAARLEPFAHDAAWNDMAGQFRLRAAVAAHLDLAAAAFDLAGDSVRQVRALTEVAQLAYRWQPAGTALERSAAASFPDRMRAALVLESQVRADGEYATADTLMLNICRGFCGALVNDPAPLIEALADDIGTPRTARGPVAQAVRSLLTYRYDIGDVDRPTVSRSIFGDNVSAVVLEAQATRDARGAADSLVQQGRSRHAAHLLHALAVNLMPLEHYAGVGASAMHAIESARAALGHVPASDTFMRAALLSVLAVSQAHIAQIDTARRIIGDAEALAAPGAPAARALIRRRAAAIESMGRDSVRAVRLATEAAEMVGDTGVAAAVHRMRTANVMMSMGQASGALRLMREAHPALVRAFTTEFTAELHIAMAEAHRLARNADSTRHYLSLAAANLATIRHDLAHAHVITAMAEEAIESGEMERARTLLDSAAAVARWAEEDDTDLRARVLNDEALLLLAGRRPVEAMVAVRLALATVNASSSEWHEATRNGAIALAMLGTRNMARSATSLPPALAPTPAEVERDIFDLERSSDDFVRGPASERLAPPRAAVRPFSEGLLQALAAAGALHDGRLSDAYRFLARATPLLSASRHHASLQLAHGVAGMLFVQIGRRDSALVRLRLAGEEGPRGLLAALQSNAPLDPAQTGGVTLRDDVLQGAGRKVEARLAAALESSRSAGNKLFETRVLEALALYHHRVRRPADLAAATAYYDSAVAVLRSDIQFGLLDWHRIQVAEQFKRLQGESTLAWLARAPELGARSAAAGAIAASDRLRGQAFAALTEVRGVGLTGTSRRAFDPYLAGRALPEVGEALFEPLGLYGPPPMTLSYVQAGDTLITFLTVPGDQSGVAAIHVSRHVLRPDTLAAAITDFRAAIGADAAATRTLTQLDTVEARSFRTRGIGVDAADAPPLEQAARRLAALLLPGEIGSFTGQLVVVPSGPIASVPFAALPLPSGVLLGERVPVAYSVSLASHSMRSGSIPSAADEREEWLASSVVVGNPTMPVVFGATRLQLDSLPGAEAEARAIAGMLGVEPLIGDAATYAAVRARSDSAAIVHLATHGFAYASEERVGDSFIALAPGEANDGILTVDDLLAKDGPRLPNASLVVLSACQTGLGQVTSSEGTLGLQRAILATGAKSVLVSLWSVSDESTAMLLEAFYTHWLEDADTPSKADALRRAQADVRSIERFAHPRYWAAFQLSGVEF